MTSDSKTRFGGVLRQHGLLIALVALYLLTMVLVSRLAGAQPQSHDVGLVALEFLKMLPLFLYFIALWRLIEATFVIRPPNRMQWLRADLKGMLTDRERLLSGLVGYVMMMIVIISFTQLKGTITLINPFSWDETFAKADAALHFGYHPYELAHAVFGHPWVITLFTGIYNFWFFLIQFGLFVISFSIARPRVRMQYLIAFVLTVALGGNLLAIILSSAGPVYYAQLGLGDTFAPLMNILQQHAATAPVTVIEIQDTVWDLYIDDEGAKLISAMPSMHVATSTLLALYAFHVGRGVGIAVSVFAVTIMIGSVLLAWHYAIDGYVGAAVAYLMWKLSGWLVRYLPWGVPQSDDSPKGAYLTSH